MYAKKRATVWHHTFFTHSNNCMHLFVISFTPLTTHHSPLTIHHSPIRFVCRLTYYYVFLNIVTGPERPALAGWFLCTAKTNGHKISNNEKSTHPFPPLCLP